jgi:hypothetical protein
MNEMLTRPIPTIAVEAFGNRLTTRQRETELLDIDLSPHASPSATLNSLLDAARTRTATSWRLVQDTVAAAAVTFLATGGCESRVARSAGEFLIVQSDSGVTRPIMDMDIDELRIGYEASQSRGAASLQPMILSAEDAALMQDAWEKGLARPKISIAPLPQYEG